MTDKTKMLTESFRPYHLDEMVGQPKAVSTVGAWIRTGRIPRTILLTGEFSAGKTTTARIIGRAVLCTAAVDGRACAKCKACVSFDAKHHPDYIEMNSASDRGIDAMRDLAMKMKLMPLMGTRKVIVLDEAHKITEAGWNAMLKTLEEPPDHVILMVVTALPGAIDSMVLSRASKLPLQAITHDDCVALLTKVAKDLKLSDAGLTKDHLARIARVAHAHPRNALHILDQVYTMVLDAQQTGNKAVDTALVNTLINQVASSSTEATAGAMVKAILMGKPASAIARAEDNRADADTLLTHLIALMRQSMLMTTSAKLADPYYKEVLADLEVLTRPDARDVVLLAYEGFVDLRIKCSSFGVPIGEVMDATIARAAMHIQKFLKASTPAAAPTKDVVKEAAKPEAAKVVTTNGVNKTKAAPEARFP